jgi:tRNA-binding EMAP/Myf-like protein
VCVCVCVCVCFCLLEELEGKRVVVMCNLKTAKLVGEKSHGMVLAASHESLPDVVSVIQPRDDVPAGTPGTECWSWLCGVVRERE